MGARGPVGKRSDKIHGHRAKDVDEAPGAAVVTRPEPDENWHKVARQWYVALGESGQTIYYEPSDWATAYLIAESISRDLNPQVVGITDSGKVVTDTIPLKGASLAAYLKAMSDLLATEGARRRASLELQRQPVEAVPDNVIDWRARATTGA